MTTGVRPFTPTTLARVLLGLVFIVHGVNGFLGVMPEVTAPVPDRALAFAAALVIAGLFPFINAIEVVAGALLLSNRFVPLALALLAPIVVNILGFYVVLAGLAPMGTALACLTFGLEAYLAWSYRAAFRPMLAARTSPTSLDTGGPRPRTSGSAQETPSAA